MELFHKFQSKGFQFSLDLLAELSMKPVLSKKEVGVLSARAGLEYPDQVMAPLLSHGILVACPDGYCLSPDFIEVHLPISKLESDYLSFILELSQSAAFLDNDMRDELTTMLQPTTLNQNIQRYVPAHEEEEQPSADALRPLLKGVRERRMVGYTFRTENGETEECWGIPYQMEYDSYGLQWYVFLYDPNTQQMERHPFHAIHDIQLGDSPSHIRRDTIQKAMENRLAPQPITLTVSKERGALERCFLAFQHREFLETRQLGSDTYHLSFRYDCAEEEEILHRLLLLGPCVTLNGPPHLRRALLNMVTTALIHNYV